jgi:hypothetical protein
MSVLSYYLNQDDSTIGFYNDDASYGSSGATTERIAYYLNSNATFAIGDIESGGNLHGITSWMLFDTSGNLYSGNPVSNTENVPGGGSISWYLYPIQISMCYYTNSANAIAGQSNYDGASIGTVIGNSGNRIAYSQDGNTIGNVDTSGGSIGS